MKKCNPCFEFKCWFHFSDILIQFLKFCTKIVCQSGLKEKKSVKCADDHGFFGLGRKTQVQETQGGSLLQQHDQGQGGLG